MTEINITGLDKAEVLAALVSSGSPPGGPGNPAFIIASVSAPATPDSVREYVSGEHLYVDYCNGIPIKTDFSGNHLDCRGYDRDHGEGAMARVVETLRA